MDSNVREAEKEDCVCKSGASLDILRDVQRAYEERMDQIERSGGAKKLQTQMVVLRSWVSDLVAQNALLVRAVGELEREAARAAAERRRHAEIHCELLAEAAALRARLLRKHSDLRGLVEVLRRLRERDSCTLQGIHFYEVTQEDIFGEDDWLARKLGHDRGDFKKDPEHSHSRQNYQQFQLL